MSAFVNLFDGLSEPIIRGKMARWKESFCVWRTGLTLFGVRRRDFSSIVLVTWKCFIRYVFCGANLSPEAGGISVDQVSLDRTSRWCRNFASVLAAISELRERRTSGEKHKISRQDCSRVFYRHFL